LKYAEAIHLAFKEEKLMNDSSPSSASPSKLTSLAGNGSKAKLNQVVAQRSSTLLSRNGQHDLRNVKYQPLPEISSVKASHTGIDVEGDGTKCMSSLYLFSLIFNYDNVLVVDVLDDVPAQPVSFPLFLSILAETLNINEFQEKYTGYSSFYHTRRTQYDDKPIEQEVSIPTSFIAPYHTISIEAYVISFSDFQRQSSGGGKRHGDFTRRHCRNLRLIFQGLSFF
jgi:hypothetical protein